MFYSSGMSSIMAENSRSEKDTKLKTFYKQNIAAEKMEAAAPVIDYRNGQKKKYTVLSPSSSAGRSCQFESYSLYNRSPANGAKRGILNQPLS